MRVLGIDPGLERIGFGLIEYSPTGATRALDWGVIKTCKTKTTAARIKDLYLALTPLIEELKPEVCVIEKLFFFRNFTTMAPVSEARGVVLLALEMANVKIAEVTPMQVKQQLTGDGKANKDDIQQMVKLRLDLEEIPRPDDAADALAIAMCYSPILMESPLNRPKVVRQLKARKKAKA